MKSPFQRILGADFARLRAPVRRLTASDEGLVWLVVGWSLLSIPLPRWTLPRINCFESGDATGCFDIDAVFPIVGSVIHYCGWLLPAEPTGKG